MLDLLDPAVQRRRVVVGLNPNGFLKDDRAVVHLFVDEVDGDPGECDPVIERVLNGVGAGEGGEQGGVNVDDRVRESFDGVRSKDPHETRQDETFRAEPIGCVTHGCAES